MKTKIIIILSVIVLVWGLLLLIFPRRSSEPLDENGNEKDVFYTSETPGSDDFLSVEQVYKSLPKPLSDYVPEGSSYEVDYFEEYSFFVITVNAESPEEYKEAMEQSFGFFYQFNLDPCKEPLSFGISWTVPDWSKVETEAEPYKELCGID